MRADFQNVLIPVYVHTAFREDVIAIDEELLKAHKAHGNKFASLHEAWAVIEEELDEIHDIMRLKRCDRDEKHLRKELVQLAAMAHKALASIDNFVDAPV